VLVFSTFKTYFIFLTQGTFSRDKHEILHSRFNINYNDIDPRFRKGSVLYRQEVGVLFCHCTTNELLNVHQVPQSEIEGPSIDKPPVLEAEDGNEAVTQTDEEASTNSGETTPTKIKMLKRRQKQRQAMMRIELQHCDIIKDGFWVQCPWILEEGR